MAELSRCELGDLADRLRGYTIDGVARGWPDVSTDLLDAADACEALAHRKRIERNTEWTVIGAEHDE